jgi:hypothetical protein
MAEHLALIKMNHINAIVDGFEDAISHFEEVYGMQVNMRIPDGGDGTEACLISLGPVMYELFAPKERGERGQGRLLAKFDDHYIGIEYQVPSVDEARQVCVTNDIRILNDPGGYFFTYAGACLGIAFELWDGDWHETRPEGPNWKNVHPNDYWQDEHPLGVLGAARVSVAVNDLASAIATLQRVTGAQMIDKVARANAAAEGAQLQVGDYVFELLAPTGPGPVADYITRYGERIRSTVYRVADLDRVTSHLSTKGITLVPGDADDALMVPPAQNKNLIFEFTE